MRTLSRRGRALVVSAALLGGSVLAPAASATSAPYIDVAGMPAYVGPWDATQWDAFLGSTTAWPGSVILDDDNGDAAFDSIWQQLTHELHQKGVQVLAYVYTSNGTRAESAVDASIDNYFPAGAVPGDTAPDGVLFDEFGTLDSSGTELTCSGLTYYDDVVGHAYQDIAAGAGSSFVASIWANPGTAVPSCYLTMSEAIDTFVTAENDETAYDTYTPYNVLNPDGTFSDGSSQFPSWRFAHEIYCVPAGDVHAVVDRAQANYAGNVSMTSDCDTSDPYSTLPANAYLNDEVTYAASL
jgi:hypothetical protein